MFKKKGVALGVNDFKTLLREDNYYIDKTNLIKEILEDKSAVKLFTRPRRFGKILNMSMLKYFLMLKMQKKIGNYLIILI